MWWLWNWVTARLVRGRTEGDKNRALNRLLPLTRPPDEVALREGVRKNIETFAQVFGGCSLTALVALSGVAEWLGPERSGLSPSAASFAVASGAAGAAWFLSMVEPAFRVKVGRRLEAPEDPEDDQQDWYFSEAVSDRLHEYSSTLVKNAVLWRLVSGWKIMFLTVSMLAFGVGLTTAVTAIG